MRIKKYINAICIMICMMSVMTACSIPGVTVPFGESGNSHESNNSKKKDAVDIIDMADGTEYELGSVPKGKKIYGIGDMVTPVRPVGNNDEAQYISFKVKSATVYDHISDAGLDDSHFYDEWDLFDGECIDGLDVIKNDETMKARFLLCDMDIDYDSEYVKYMTTDNVTAYSLIYVNDDGKYVITGFPIYFSTLDKSKDAFNQNDFDVHEGTVNIQIGWVIDKDIYGVKEFDVSRLYLCTAYDNKDDVCKELVNLGLKD